jgi:hypothetical protein
MQELPSMAKFHGVPPSLVVTSHSTKSNKPMTSGVLTGIERWPLDRLIPYARNARTHSEDQVAQIAASIVEFGWLNPVLVDDAGSVIAGHGRLLAARKLGLDSVPVIRASHLTPAQVRAYRLADNRLAELSGWNEEMLAAELAALRDEDVDLRLLGFDDAEIDRVTQATRARREDAQYRPPSLSNALNVVFMILALACLLIGFVVVLAVPVRWDFQSGLLVVILGCLMVIIAKLG